MIKIHQTKDSRKPKVRFVPMTRMAAAAYNALAAGKENDAPSAPTAMVSRFTK